uniref:Leucine carboxyl methyltransferase 1 n=1 Tax=Compsopogon caeruleus TaxID=31354 RepID=A0A6T6C1G3_9RHOD|mmetsp:Transcript_205/g.360  ORF Transcript_205/g.360 Transcript_205/m.360 type:complete len:283 (+) Transcript_205:1960-2808(+)
MAIFEATKKFLLDHQHIAKVQVVSLGCGSDSLFWRLCADTDVDSRSSYFAFVEIDFPDSAARKAERIRQDALLSASVGSLETGTDPWEGEILHSDRYILMGCDIRDTGSLMTRISRVTKRRLPTMVISECVLCYLEPRTTDMLTSKLVSHFDDLSWISYDPVGSEDSFGRRMVENLAQRGCGLPGIHRDLQGCTRPFHNAGFCTVHVADMLTVYNMILDTNQRRRIERIEFLDELEEWNLVMKHYALLWASNAPSPTPPFDFTKHRTESRANISAPHHPYVR